VTSPRSPLGSPLPFRFSESAERLDCGPRAFPGRDYDNWKTTDPRDAEPDEWEREDEPDPDDDVPLFVIVGWEWLQ
jgi:hypothetical protein